MCANDINFTNFMLHFDVILGFYLANAWNGQRYFVLSERGQPSVAVIEHRVWGPRRRGRVRYGPRYAVEVFDLFYHLWGRFR